MRLGSILVTAASGDLEVFASPRDWVVGPATLFQPDLLVARAGDVPSLTVLDLEGGQYTEVTTVTGDRAWESEFPIRATIIPSALVAKPS